MKSRSYRGPRVGAKAAFCPGHRGRWERTLRPWIPPVTPARPARPSRAGVLAASSAVAWLLLWAAGLVGRLAPDISDAPFSAGKGVRATCSEIILRREFLKDGFHGDLLVKVKFGESTDDLWTCRLLINTAFQQDSVDPYGLLRYERNIPAAVMVSGSFNIEAPNYLTKESAVLISARQDAQ